MALRILAVTDVWQGSNGYAYVRAFQRLGHSVRLVPIQGFIPTDWRRRPLRLLRRCLDPWMVREFNNALLTAASEHRPDLFFVYKGRHVKADTIRRIRDGGAVAVTVYPDVSFLAHGPHLPRALPAYDWVFHTKRFGVRDLQRVLGVRHASFLPHAYDPDVHRPVPLDERDRAMYAAEVSFIGTWSPKKQRLLEHLAQALPTCNLRIWGDQWSANRSALGRRVQGCGVHGLEYAKALVASRINLGILSEARRGASSGDRITARTFYIPATGAFMLHERTEELLEYFDEDVECACFASPDELVAKVERFLVHDAERVAIAAAGHRRVVEDGHSVDCRAAAVLDHVARLRRPAVA